jgi:hypothetical protein
VAKLFGRYFCNKNAFPRGNNPRHPRTTPKSYLPNADALFFRDLPSRQVMILRSRQWVITCPRQAVRLLQTPFHQGSRSQPGSRRYLLCRIRQQPDGVRFLGDSVVRSDLLPNCNNKLFEVLQLVARLSLRGCFQKIVRWTGRNLN